MKRTSINPEQFGLRLLDQFLQSEGLQLSDESADEKFIQRFSALMREHRRSDTRVHGLRIQTMFAYFAAALGGCKIISEEDSGELFVASGDFKRPDFRILTHEGDEFFVEVKNFNQGDPKDEYILKADYANSP
jgi:hypothetical protein